MLKYFFLATAVVSCGGNDDSDKANCDGVKAALDADVQLMNFCKEASDCRATGVNPHYGCYMFHHKDSDTTAMQARIDEWSESECWDGMTTLRLQTPMLLLKCGMVRDEDLACNAGRCEIVPFST